MGAHARSAGGDGRNTADRCHGRASLAAPATAGSKVRRQPPPPSAEVSGASLKKNEVPARNGQNKNGEVTTRKKAGTRLDIEIYLVALKKNKLTTLEKRQKMGQKSVSSLQTTKANNQKAAFFKYIFCSSFDRVQRGSPHQKTAANSFALHPPERRVAGAAKGCRHSRAPARRQR